MDEFLVNPSFKKNLISRYISFRILYIYREYDARIYWRLKNLASSRDSSLKDQPRVNPHLVLLPRRFLKVPRPCTRCLHSLLLWLLLFEDSGFHSFNPLKNQCAFRWRYLNFY